MLSTAFARGSTSTQLSSIVHDWSSVLQKRSQVDVVFLDFQKAFDRVPHHRLWYEATSTTEFQEIALNWMHVLSHWKKTSCGKLMELNPRCESCNIRSSSRDLSSVSNPFLVCLLMTYKTTSNPPSGCLLTTVLSTERLWLKMTTSNCCKTYNFCQSGPKPGSWISM